MPSDDLSTAQPTRGSDGTATGVAAAHRFGSASPATNSVPSGDEQARRVLQQRAEAYARKPQQETLAADFVEVMVVRVGDERIGLPDQFICEILRDIPFTPVPGAPPQLLGLINVRGEVIPVFDLASLTLAGARDGARTKETAAAAKTTDDDTLGWVVTIGRDRAGFALNVDEASEVRNVSALELQRAESLQPELETGLVRGVTRDSLIVLDGPTLLADPRLMIGAAEDDT